MHLRLDANCHFIIRFNDHISIYLVIFANTIKNNLFNYLRCGLGVHVQYITKKQVCNGCAFYTNLLIYMNSVDPHL